MTRLKLSLLASVVLGLAFIGGASAIPLSNGPAAGENTAQNARIVCDQWGHCYNTRYRRGARYHRHNGYQDYDNGYYRSQRSFGFGPFGLF